MWKPRFSRHVRDAHDAAPGSPAPGPQASEAAGPKVPGFPDLTLDEALLVTPLAIILMACGFEPQEALITPSAAETWYGPLNVARAEKDGRAIVAFRLPGASDDYLNGLRCVASLRYPGVRVNYSVAYVVLRGPSRHVSGLWAFLMANGPDEEGVAAFGAIIDEDINDFEADFQA